MEHEAKIGRLAELDSFAENLAQIRHNNDRIAQQLASLQVIYYYRFISHESPS